MRERLFSLLIIFLCLISVSWSSENWADESIEYVSSRPGIHQLQTQEFGNIVPEPVPDWVIKDEISKTQALQSAKISSNQAASLGRIVFSYIPSWECTTAKVNWLQWKYLTHVCWHSVGIQTTGKLTLGSVGSNNTQYLIQKAHQNNVKAILSLTCFDNGANEPEVLLSNPTATYTSLTAMKAVVIKYGFDGVSLDLEGMTASSANKARLSSYMISVASTMKTIGASYQTAIATEPLNSNYDYNVLTNNLDVVFVMWYNFYYSGSGSTGPNAPLSRGGYYSSSCSLLSKINSYIQPAGVNKSKLVMGFPLYGLSWRTNSASAHASVISGSYTSVISNIFYVANTTTNAWDTASQTPWYYYQDTPTTYRQIWQESAESLGYKYDLINNLGIGGVGYWAHSYDYPRNDNWDMLSTKFWNITSDPQGIKNGEFENTRSNWVNWEYSSSNLSVSKPTPKSGSSALSLTQSGGTGLSFYQTDGRVSLGDTWTLSAWAYQNGFSNSSCNLGWVGSYSPNTKGSTNVNVPSGGTWKHYYITNTFGSNSAGYRDVQLTLTGAGTVYLDEVRVFKGLPGASFTASPVSGYSPLTVNFYDQSTDGQSWSWNFGNGGTSTAKNPVYIYSATTESWFTVQQIVNLSYGAATVTKSQYIHVIPSLFYCNYAVASDTSLFAEELVDGKASLPARSWTSVYSGATGLATYNFTSGTQGIKLTLNVNQWLNATPKAWYKYEIRVCGSTSPNNLVAALYGFQGVPPSAFELGTQVLMAVPSTWTTMTFYFRGNGGTTNMYPQLVFQNSSGSSSLYLDYIRITQENPPSLSQGTFPGGDFSPVSDTTYWAVEPTASGMVIVPWSIQNGYFQGDFSGNQGIKLTMANGPTSTYTIPVSVGKTAGFTGKAIYSGVMNNFFLIMVDFGAPSSGSTSFSELSGIASYQINPASDSGNVAFYHQANQPYLYGQILVSNNATGTFTLDNYYPLYQ